MPNTNDATYYVVQLSFARTGDSHPNSWFFDGAAANETDAIAEAHRNALRDGVFDTDSDRGEPHYELLPAGTILGDDGYPV